MKIPVPGSRNPEQMATRAGAVLRGLGRLPPPLSVHRVARPPGPHYRHGVTRVIDACAHRRLLSTEPAASSHHATLSAALKPTRAQLATLALASGLPFVGFGFADNAIMIMVGDQIDSSLGVRFGISTMAAAGLGNLFSDVVGISLVRRARHAPHSSHAQGLRHAMRAPYLRRSLTSARPCSAIVQGEVIEACVARFITAPPLSPEQLNMRQTRLVKGSANAIGIAIGCLIGMFPLLWINDRKPVYFDDDEMALFHRQFAPCTPHGMHAVCMRFVCIHGVCVMPCVYVRRWRLAAAVFRATSPRAVVHGRGRRHE